MSLTNETPRLLVFAGPNGSGKSTVTNGIPTIGHYINAAAIKRDSGCSDLEAAQEAEALREHMLQFKKSFTFETVLSTPRNLNLIERAKQAGYEIFAVFVLTRDPNINVLRVKHRALMGGHDVPEDKIISRYTKSIANLPLLVRLADRTRIVDNSGEVPKLICEVKDQSVSIYETDGWTQNEILVLLTMPNRS